MFLFLLDSVVENGFGHLKRCGCIALELEGRGYRCILAINELESVPAQLRSPFSECVCRDMLHDYMSFLKTVKSKWKCKKAIYDSVRLDSVVLKALTAEGFTTGSFVTANDNPRDHDFVICQNLGVDIRAFQRQAGRKRQRVLSGLDFSLIGREFYYDKCCVRDPKVIALAITGGRDEGLLTWQLLTLLDRICNNTIIEVFCGKNNAGIEKLRALIGNVSSSNTVKLRVESRKIANSFRKSSIAVTSGGVSCLEAIRCGSAVLMVSLNEAQELQCRAIDSLGSACFVGNIEESVQGGLEASLRRLQGSKEAQKALSENARKTFDGLGAARIAEFLIEI